LAAAPGRLVLLDRDGVINEDSGEFIKSVTEWQPIPGSLDGIAALHRAGFKVVVVTNQSGVGRGLLTEAVLLDIHRHMSAAIERAGGALAGIYYCPHTPDAGCECRKPRVGLLRRIERDLRCSLAGVPFIGDRVSDVDAADVVGARAILVRTGTGAATAQALRARTIEVYDDLRAATRALLAEVPC
jgi:D-glycero-D-manno-heptose 1,7-bisphosphate phosphatase